MRHVAVSCAAEASGRVTRVTAPRPPDGHCRVDSSAAKGSSMFRQPLTRFLYAAALAVGLLATAVATGKSAQAAAAGLALTFSRAVVTSSGNQQCIAAIVADDASRLTGPTNSDCSGGS